MSRYELHIDNIQVDLDDKFNFSLTYTSPIFSDISKIASNSSNTIKIPKTANNLRAIENCQMPDNTSSFPYKNHSADIFKDGIPIVQGGFLVIFVINTYIELVVAWGNIGNVRLFEDTKLRDMKGDEPIRWMPNENKITTSNKNIGLTNAYFSQLGVIRYQHPFVSFNWLLDRISNTCGVSFAFPDYVLEEKETLYIPLVEKNTSSGTLGALSFAINTDFTINLISSTTGGVQLDYLDDKTFVITEDGTFFLAGNWHVVDRSTNFRFSGFRLQLFVNGEPEGDGVSISASNPDTYTFIGNFHFTKENSSIDVSQNDRITYILYAIIEGTSSVIQASLMESSGILNAVADTKHVPLGSMYPIIPNLPDITCLDAVKNIMSLLGLFAYYDTTLPNTIKLFSLDEMYERKTVAKDWTSKLLTGSTIDNITYTFQDYAMQNHMRYLKDETVSTYADGTIKVDNETLLREKELLELKFAASETRGGLIYIPLYRMEDEKLVYTKSTNRIAKLEIGETSSSATFPASMYFYGNDGILKRRYSKYQEILLRPKVIEATFLLNGLDLYNIDLITPIYLEQTGHYYAIIEIKVGETHSTCKLLQM